MDRLIFISLLYIIWNVHIVMVLNCHWSKGTLGTSEAVVFI